MDKNISTDYQNNNNSNSRKSSCATVVPPPPPIAVTTTTTNKQRKASIPLTINCNSNNRQLDTFYDTNILNDISSTTIVASKKSSPIYSNHVSSNEQEQSPFSSALKSVVQKLKRCTTTKDTAIASNMSLSSISKTNWLKANHDDINKSLREQQVYKTLSGEKVIRHSYSDSHLSPGSTAVGDDNDDVERNGHFGPIRSIKKKKSPRGWIAVVLMIIFGALIAVTFVLVGLGKALGGRNTGSVTNAQQRVASNSTTLPSLVASTTSNHPTLSTSLNINSSDRFIIKTNSVFSSTSQITKTQISNVISTKTTSYA